MFAKTIVAWFARFACSFACFAGLGGDSAFGQLFEYPSGDISDLETKGPNRNLPPKAVSVSEAAKMRAFLKAFAPAPSAIVTTLSMPEGDKVDCVYRDAQPSLLNRPDHVLQESPSFEVKGRASRILSKPPLLQSYGTATIMCPEGTIPMQRLTFETLARFGSLEAFMSKDGRTTRPESRPGPTDVNQHAALRLYNFFNRGAEAVLNLWDPYVGSYNEFTLSQIWVVGGYPDNIETVEAGWHKYPKLYNNDWTTRLFIYYTPNNYCNPGILYCTCYNLACGSFVQVNTSVYIGGPFSKYSIINGDQYEIKLLWFKDGTTGHWWLRYFDTWVGYYPRDLFDSTGLRDQADTIGFGGEISNDLSAHPGQHTATDMGSGLFPAQGFGQAAYQRAIRYVDTNNYYHRATNLERDVADSLCYDLLTYSSSGEWEEYFFFGGPGYSSNCE